MGNEQIILVLYQYISASNHKVFHKLSNFFNPLLPRDFPCYLSIGNCLEVKGHIKARRNLRVGIITFPDYTLGNTTVKYC